MGGINKREVVVDKEIFLGVLSSSKSGGVVCTCVKDHIIKGKDQYKAIRLRGFDYELFDKE